MLVNMNKPCLVPHASRITISGTIFTETFLVCPMNESDLGYTFPGQKIKHVKTLGSFSKKRARKKEKKERQLQSFLRYTQTQENK